VNINDLKTRLLTLLQTFSFKRGNFILASGKRSDFFIDVKKSVLDSEGHYLTGKIILEELKKKFPSCQALGGVALGGCPLVSATSTLSYIEGRPLAALYVRKQRKDHGTKGLVEFPGRLPKDLQVVIIEDVVTTGETTLFAIQAIKGAGFKPIGVITLVDREEGGKQRIEEKAKIVCYAIYSKRDFF
jgi:orotate phosphoribosyltransferase